MKGATVSADTKYVSVSVDFSLNCRGFTPVIMPERSEFRGDIPAYKPPDRAAWEQEHGVKPYSLGRVREAYVSRALAAIRNDYSAIERGQAIGSEVSLDRVCERVHTDSNLPDDSVVFFDPSGEQFWVYPHASI